jgi:hypothetical protein
VRKKGKKGRAKKQTGKGGGGKSNKKQKHKKGKKTPKKAIKEEELNIKVLTHELIVFTFLSNANSFVVLQPFKSLFIDFFHVKFGLLLFSLPV